MDCFVLYGERDYERDITTGDTAEGEANMTAVGPPACYCVLSLKCNRTLYIILSTLCAVCLQKI